MLGTLSVPALFVTTIWAAVGRGLTLKFAPLSVPISAGFEATTRMRYPVPCVWLLAIKDEIVPEVAVLESVPMRVGEAKEPAPSESSAVKMLPAVKVALVLV